MNFCVVEKTDCGDEGELVYRISARRAVYQILSKERTSFLINF